MKFLVLIVLIHSILAGPATSRVAERQLLIRNKLKLERMKSIYQMRSTRPAEFNRKDLTSLTNNVVALMAKNQRLRRQRNRRQKYFNQFA